MTAPWIFPRWYKMDRCVGAAALLAESDRKDLAIQVLARSATISDLSVRHGVSRKFIYQKTDKARTALDEAFLSAALDDEVVFELTVTKTWLRQVIVGLTLICRSSYRGVVEFLRDLLGVAISIGTVHHVLEWATQQAGVINRDQDLSGIRVGLHDELFHGAMPVLAGVDAASIYCYLLAAGEHRDADTWAVHLLDAARQGLQPDYTIADAGQGLRAGQKAAWDDTPCHGDVFHIQHQCEGLANALSRLAKGAKSRHWQGWNRLRAKLGGTFHAAFDAVSRAVAETPRSSSLVETLNSRLRTYFTLRRHLGGAYLDLLQFFLNHRASCAADVPSATAK